MAPSSWPNDLQKSLTWRRLPREYAQRLMDELLDHFQDLMEENPHMDTTTLATRLGDPDRLATIAAAEYRRRTFIGRHPIITFVVAPIPAVAVAIIGTLLMLWEMCWLIPDESLHGPDGIAITSIVLASISWTLRLMPFALAAAIFSRAAARAGCDWRWGLTASVLVALFAGSFGVWYDPPTVVPDSGRFGLSFVVPPGPIQLLQLSVPLAIALWHARRKPRKAGFSTV